MMSALFLFNSTSLGIGLAMDAFSVSIVNGINESSMSKPRAIGIAGVYGFFQALMTILGWICTHTVIIHFGACQRCIPWISLVLLLMIGIHMLRRGSSCAESDRQINRLSPGIVLLQGLATSVDALSAGLTIADYDFIMALICAVIIAGETIIICVVGIELGKKMGIRMADRASLFGGILLILVGIETWLTGIL